MEAFTGATTAATSSENVLRKGDRTMGMAKNEILMRSRDQAATIFEECLSIEARTGAHLFFDYFPHVNSISIGIHVNKWKRGIGADLDVSGTLETVHEIKKIKEELSELPEKIKNLQNDKGLAQKKRVAALKAELKELKG
ncbi:MAG: hypothetical protein GY820_17350 [Gammaproteobacteria bacterium]|nr:hypothetical protein [Gammaproteobacteria bacterium]